MNYIPNADYELLRTIAVSSPYVSWLVKIVDIKESTPNNLLYIVVIFTSTLYSASRVGLVNLQLKSVPPYKSNLYK